MQCVAPLARLAKEKYRVRFLVLAPQGDRWAQQTPQPTTLRMPTN